MKKQKIKALEGELKKWYGIKLQDLDKRIEEKIDAAMKGRSHEERARKA